jgi:hypothetical protein
MEEEEKDIFLYTERVHGSDYSMCADENDIMFYMKRCKNNIEVLFADEDILKKILIVPDYPEKLKVDKTCTKIECRLFIKNDTIYYNETSNDSCPPQTFLQDILVKNTWKYIVIDVGLSAGNEWCIMNIHPPFGLTPFGPMPMRLYYTYCRDAWKWLINCMSTKHSL